MTARTYGDVECTVCGVTFTKTRWNMKRCPEHRLNWSDPQPEAPPPPEDRVEAARQMEAQTGRRVVAARYPGMCPLCHARFTVGDMISPGGPSGMSWGHADCMEIAGMLDSVAAEGRAI